MEIVGPNVPFAPPHENNINYSGDIKQIAQLGEYTMQLAHPGLHGEGDIICVPLDDLGACQKVVPDLDHLLNRSGNHVDE